MRHLVVEQEAGEIIFVPSGYWHEVLNLELTMSINENWLNSSNADLVFEYLLRRLHDIEASLADCQEADDYALLCQKVLRADAGIDFFDFVELLRYAFIDTRGGLQRHRIELETINSLLNLVEQECQRCCLRAPHTSLAETAKSLMVQCADSLEEIS